MKEAGYIIRNIVKGICAFPLVLPGIVYAIDNKGLKSLKTYTPHELNTNTTPIGCVGYVSSQLEFGKSIDVESKANLKLCGFKDAAIAGVTATGDNIFRRNAHDVRKSATLFDRSVNYSDRIKNALTKKYDRPAQEEVHMDLYDELYNQNNGGRRSFKWRLKF
ncbi:MAG: hypothetical protein ACN4GR_17070 [Arenicellales bacterium]